MNMTPERYKEIAASKEEKTKCLQNCIWAFFIGGAICTLGQAFSDFYTMLGLSKELTSAATAISLILLSAIFTALDLYDGLARYAGAGTIVPITGFANSIVSAAIEFKSEGYVMGMGAKMFTVAGPVIVFGTVASFIYGLIYWLFLI